MDVSLEIGAMPGPQWLFGFRITEAQRLRFIRLYLAASCDAPLSGQPDSVLDDMLDRCMAAGMKLAIPRLRALEILRRPGVFAWTRKKRGARDFAAVTLGTRACIERAKLLLARSRVV